MVTVALAQVLILLLGYVSVMGLLVNVLAMPWVTLVVTARAMLGVLFPWFWNSTSLAMAMLMSVLQWLAVLWWQGPTPPLGNF